MDESRAALLLRALEFASRRHRDQRRKGDDRSPYINHPISVAALLAGPAGIDDRAVLAAAALHDTIEDTETTATTRTPVSSAILTPGGVAERMPVPEHFYRQSGVIPLRRREGAVEVLLVTSRSGKRWVIPKGVVEKGLSPSESAIREVWEEAGLRGRIGAVPLGIYRYRKWQGICTVEVFTLEVEEEAGSWPEEQSRNRRWMRAETAAAAVSEKDLGSLILKAAGGKKKRQ